MCEPILRIGFQWPRRDFRQPVRHRLWAPRDKAVPRDGERRAPPRDGVQSETPCARPRWELSAPAVSGRGLLATALPRGTWAARPQPIPSSPPAPRQYAAGVGDDEGRITRAGRASISPRNELGEARRRRGLRGKVLVSWIAVEGRASTMPPPVDVLEERQRGAQCAAGEDDEPGWSAEAEGRQGGQGDCGVEPGEDAAEDHGVDQGGEEEADDGGVNEV